MQSVSSSIKKSSLIGFDGFTDHICFPCDKRISVDQVLPIAEIAHLGERITQSAGKSCNIEIISKETKLGGNAPILANALLELDQDIFFVGSIGEGKVEELFSSMAERCQKAVAVARSGHTDALEFQDGKILLGQLEHLRQVNYEALLKAVPLSEWISWFNQIDLFAACNWTMLYGMPDIWKGLLRDVLPHSAPRKEKPWMFLDLADPAKRIDSDLLSSLELFQAFSPYFRLSLGLNSAESVRLFNLIALKSADSEDEAARAQALCKALKLDHVVIHTRRQVSLADANSTYQLQVPFCAKPALATGAGDNFNAGYTFGLLQGQSPLNCLRLAIAVSGHYVRHGKSPKRADVIRFLSLWQEGSL
ncbi:MAG: hypothetical protein K0S07_701 [Chlamydiales bacterium]|jgi:sugar/nucleoside kinase (ribokinase family)|nr:hypothetical protein [Chlamydiales bacterium]